MIVLIDNYDSFTYNLYQYISRYDHVKVIRNDEISIEELDQLRPSGIVISPGPKTPNEAGISVETVNRFAGEIPILGVCLGHQSIGIASGAKVVHGNRIMHGKSSKIKLKKDKLFKNMPEEINVARYHSLVVTDVLDNIEVLSEIDGEIMAMKYRDYDVYGLQFHPESILTEYGYEIIKNFVDITKS